MSKHFLTLIEYNSIELHPLIIGNTWLLSNKEVSLALKTNIATIIEALDTLVEGKHYSYESVEYEKNKTTSSILFFSKTGIVRLAYHLKTDEALEFIEFIEDIDLAQNSEDSSHGFYKEIESILHEKLAKLKENPDASLEEINRFILTLDNLINKRDNKLVEKSTSSLNISDILETVIGLAQSYAVKKNN